MKKIVMSGLAIFILAGGIIFYIFSNQSLEASQTIEKEAIQQEKFLNDKQAVIYFSTTADQDMDDKGISYAVFINDNGQADAYKMNGLELGNVSAGENEVLLVDKNKLRLIGDSYKEFDMKRPQFTGERTGYLEKQDLYFSIFNTGINNDGGYDSNVYFGNSGGFKNDNIPYYILASGSDQNEVPILTHDVEKNQYHFRKVTFTDNGVSVQEIVPLENEKGSEFANLSPIVSDEEYYYVVLSEIVNDTSANTVLVQINKKTQAQEKINLTTYKNEDNLSATIPYNAKNSAYLNNGVLYYANGLGEVYAFDTKTKKSRITFTIEEAPQDGVRHNEETFFKDNHLHVVRFNEKANNKYSIEKYSLDNGDKMDEYEIKGLEDILNSVRGKSIYSYDLKVF
ncbi:hypothetical protein [Metabacillus idriensis]|uniref:hypothetical protein n=1 Tax=Metabacillus idriensis TaxID=324768 RepID=UPI003D2D9F41